MFLFLKSFDFTKNFYIDFTWILKKSQENCCLSYVWDALRDLVPFVQFKQREKHPWRSFSAKVCNFLKSNTPP